MPRASKIWFRKSKGYHFTTIDGKQYRLAKTKKESETRLQQLLRSLGQGETRDPPFAAVCAKFLAHSQAENDPETYDVHRLFLLGPVTSRDADGGPVRSGGFADRAGKKPVSRVCEADLDAWLRTQDGWNDNSKVRARAVVLAALNYGTKKMNLPPHGLRHVRPGTVGSRDRVLTEEERKKVREAVAGCFADYLRVLELSGARPFSEIAAVTAADFDPAKGTLTLAKWKNSKKQKGKKRVIYLVPEALEVVKKLAARHPVGPLFRNSLGDPWSRQTLTARFRALAARLGIEGLTAYTYRHTAITDALVRAVPVAICAELYGTSAQTIARHYAHVDKHEDVLREAMQKATG